MTGEEGSAPRTDVIAKVKQPDELKTALQACSPEVDGRWAREQAEWCAALGVTWMPPVTFARRAPAEP